MSDLTERAEWARWFALTSSQALDEALDAGDEQRLRVLIASVEASHDRLLGLDAPDAKSQRVARAVALLQWGRSVTDPAAPVLPKARQTTEQAGGAIAALARSQDPNGLGTIPAEAWARALDRWEGVEVSRRGNPARGGRPYSWSAVVHELLAAHGLTDASSAKALRETLRIAVGRRG